MQSDRQRAYDRGSTIFSPDGRLYQVEYAREAVERGSSTVGVRTNEGVVLATHRRRRSSLVEPESIEKLHDVDGRLGMATAGHVADGRHLVDYGRQYAQRERLRYGEAPGVQPVAKALADYVQESTQTGGTRPFGAAVLLGGAVDAVPSLYELDPSGTPTEWRATAVGAGSEAIRSHLEAEYDRDADVETGLTLALRSLAEGIDRDLTASDLALASVDADGFESFDRGRRQRALDEAGLSQAS